MDSSSSSPSQPAVATTLLGLPDELLGQRIVAHPALDPAARLALFRSCHGLARLVLMHAPGSSKRVTHHVSREWSPTLAHLFGAKWQPLPPEQLDLELRVESSVEQAVWSPQPPLPPLPPPTSITHHVSCLHLRQLTLNTAVLAAWLLHDPARWPHLRHLNIVECTQPQAATTLYPPPPPIPRLQSFAWDGGGMWDGSAAALQLAANATHAHLTRSAHASPWWSAVVERLPHLTHLRLEDNVDPSALQALVNHPTLENVTLDSLWPFGNLSRQPCRWRTLSLARRASLRWFADLPVAGLERLSIAGTLDGWCKSEEEPAVAAGLAALQRLHGEGKLALLPNCHMALLPTWTPTPNDAVFILQGADNWSAALLRLVVEAGRGLTTLLLSSRALPLPLLRDQVAPLLQQRGAGGIRTLWVWLEGPVTEEWCAGLLGALPASVAHVKVRVHALPSVNDRVITALVRGGLQGRRHPLRLTLLHEGVVGAGLEAALMRMVAGGGRDGGTAGEQQQQVAASLTLEVVWVSW